MPLINEREGFIGLISHSDSPRGFIYPDKTGPASLLNEFKNIPGKACLNGVDNNDAFVNVGN